MAPISYTTFESPLGELLLVAQGDALAGLYFDTQPLPDWYLDDTAQPFLPVKQQLAEYFAGTRTAFDLPLYPHGTEFQLRVWRELQRIPYGETITYGEQTQRLGLPAEAVRSIGTTNGQNPLCIIVPCHRVIGANGKLTGYSGGLEHKRALLELESPVRSLFAV